MILPGAPLQYSQPNESEARNLLMQEDKRNAKKGETLFFNRNEVILSAPDGSRWAIKVDNAGTLSTEARS